MVAKPAVVVLSALIMLWFVGIVILFVFLARKFTFGKWTKDSPNPFELETFAMPRGVFRGILTLSLLYIVMLFEVFSLMTTPELQINDQLMVAFQMMLAFYFGSKIMHHVTAADQKKTMAEAEASLPRPPAGEEAVG